MFRQLIFAIFFFVFRMPTLEIGSDGKLIVNIPLTSKTIKVKLWSPNGKSRNKITLHPGDRMNIGDPDGERISYYLVAINGKSLVEICPEDISRIFNEVGISESDIQSISTK